MLGNGTVRLSFVVEGLETDGTNMYVSGGFQQY